MCYRLTSHYQVICDRCGLTAPEVEGWSTPTAADEAALSAGWEMTTTEHLCPACMADDVPLSCVEVARVAPRTRGRGRAEAVPR